MTEQRCGWRRLSDNIGARRDDTGGYVANRRNIEQAMSQEQDVIVSAEIEPVPDHGTHAAAAMQNLGFRVLHIGTTVSVEGPRALWESEFKVRFEPAEATLIREVGQKARFLRANSESIHLPKQLDGLVSDVVFVEPPEFYAGGPSV